MNVDQLALMSARGRDHSRRRSNLLSAVEWIRDRRRDQQPLAAILPQLSDYRGPVLRAEAEEILTEILAALRHDILRACELELESRAKRAGLEAAAIQRQLDVVLSAFSPADGEPAP